jgi:hypothetical protein
MVGGGPEEFLIYDPYHFVALAFRNFGVEPPLSSRSGQRRADLGRDPMVREAPEGSLDLWFSSLRDFGVQGDRCHILSILPE